MKIKFDSILLATAAVAAASSAVAYALGNDAVGTALAAGAVVQTARAAAEGAEEPKRYVPMGLEVK